MRKGRGREHAAPAVAAPVRRRGAGPFEFGMTAAIAGILQITKGLPIVLLYDATMGIGVLTHLAIKTPKDR